MRFAPLKEERQQEISSQVRRGTGAIRREVRRRAAIEPVIGSKPSTAWAAITSSAATAIAFNAAAGHNFSLLPRWFARLLRALLLALSARPQSRVATNQPRKLSSRARRNAQPN
jgi:hypothetical protein